MNRRIIVTVSMMAVMSVAMAQKPSAQKQDEIIEGQKALDVKLDEPRYLMLMVYQLAKT